MSKKVVLMSKLTVVLLSEAATLYIELCNCFSKYSVEIISFQIGFILLISFIIFVTRKM